MWVGDDEFSHFVTFSERFRKRIQPRSFFSERGEDTVARRSGEDNDMYGAIVNQDGTQEKGYELKPIGAVNVQVISTH